jgi:hypothetical protein
VAHARFAPDGKTLAVITSTGDLRLYDFPLPGPARQAIVPALTAGAAIYLSLALWQRRRRRKT